MTTLAVIGAQYGSEGKGVIVHHLADDFQVHVRVGGPQAGHSFMHDNVLYKMRCIPCGWTNLGATLVIGRGAVIDPDVLVDELAMISKVDPLIYDRLFVDTAAWCVSNADRINAKVDRTTQRYGATGEGVGQARVRRLARDLNDDLRFGSVAAGYGLSRLVHSDTVSLLNWLRGSRSILLEGTQGAGLSLIHGPWPYTTNHDTSAAQLAADCGLPPDAIDDVLLVMRTYPIRVAGNSGPLEHEIDWEILSARLGREVREYTTVTNRQRRIGEWEDGVIRLARMINGAKHAALTFADYLDPEVEGLKTLSPIVTQFIRLIEERHAFKVMFVGTGGPNFTVVDHWEGE